MGSAIPKFVVTENAILSRRFEQLEMNYLVQSQLSIMVSCYMLMYVVTVRLNQIDIRYR